MAGNAFAKVVSRVPFVNFFYFAFYSLEDEEEHVSSVSIDSVSSVGNTVGLVAALLYTVMTALPTGLAWDELDAVDEFWQGPTLAQMEEHGFKKANSDGEWTGSTEGTNITIGKWGCQWSSRYQDTKMSIRLADSISGTAMVLVVTIMMAVVLIVSGSTLTRTRHFDDKGKDDEEGEGEPSRDFSVPETAMDEWWSVMRFVTLVTVAMMLYGVMLSVNVMNDLSYIKFTQPWLERRCDDAGWVLIPDSDPDNAPTYENGTMIEYLASYSGGRVGLTKGEDPLFAYGVGYIWGFVAVFFTIVAAGYAQMLAHLAIEVDATRKTPLTKKGSMRKGSIEKGSIKKAPKKESTGNSVDNFGFPAGSTDSLGE